MATNNDPNIDSGHRIQVLQSSVIAGLQAYSATFSQMGQAAGVTALDIAAPIAREMNKTASGDYYFNGLGTLAQAIKNDVARYGTAATENAYSGAPTPWLIPLTNADYVTNLQFVAQNNLQNTQSSGFTGYLNRIDNPPLNDLGVAKIQVGTAMNAVRYYDQNRELFGGSDPFGLQKYIGNTPQLVQDLINPSTSMQTSIGVQAVIAYQGAQWGSANIGTWSQYSDAQKASFITGFSRKAINFGMTSCRPI